MFEMTYAPREDTYFLLDYLEEIDLEGKRVLEMGTGSGLIAVDMAEQGAEVTAVDIDGDSLEEARKLVEERGVSDSVSFFQSNLFEDVEGKFDLVVFNPPYLPDEEGLDDHALFGGETGMEITERFVDGVDDHLRSDGRTLVVSSSRADVERLEALGLEKADSHKIWFETLYILEK